MPTLVRNRNKFPASVRHIEVLSGISIGGCVRTQSDLDDAAAHAHTSVSDQFFGWICFHSELQLETNDLLHEVAHLLASKNDHNVEWLEKFLELGGELSDNRRVVNGIRIDANERYIIGHNYPWLKERMLQVPRKSLKRWPKELLLKGID